MDDSTQYWVGFNLVKGIGPGRLRTLLDYFGDIQTAWQAPVSTLEETGLGSKLISALVETRSSGLLDATMRKIEEQQITVLTWDSLSYPRRLLETDGPPPVLYMRGEILEEDQWAVAIVGTRRATAYGRQVTKEFAQTFARSGISVVSGLARGIDALAHQFSLDEGGRTLAVLGSGVDVIYPPEHRQLAERIISNGALVSDYPPGTAPEASNFPPRNRIISGLAQAVIVVEAGARSGALITAAFAAEQGRTVFAVPGAIYAPQSRGTNILIREGAQILLDPQSVLEMLNLVQVGEYRAARAALPADATEASLFNILSNEPLHVDDIRARANLPIEKVSAALTMMELKGMVRQVGSMRYIAVYEESGTYDVTGG